MTENHMFGMSMEDLENELPDYYSPHLWAMSILSDAQEALASGRSETARQWINKAKYWMGQLNIVQRFVEDIYAGRIDHVSLAFETNTISASNKSGLTAQVKFATSRMAERFYTQYIVPAFRAKGD